MYVSSWPGLNPTLWLAPEQKKKPPFPFYSDRAIAFYVARNGIYHLFRGLGLGEKDTVLVPDYHSGLETWAIRAAGASIRFYPVRRNLEPDLDALCRLSRQGARVLYAIHFLGWPQPLREMRELCRERDMILIEDCAHSLLGEIEEGPLGTFGDYSVFCLYKTLPVPNGGLLVQNRRGPEAWRKLTLNSCSRLSLLGRTAEMQLEWLRSRADLTGAALFGLKRAMGRMLGRMDVRRLPVGDMEGDLGAVNTAMSALSSRLLRRFDYEEICRRRRDNFLALRRMLAGRIEFLDKDVDDGVCPLFFPILVRNKHAVAQELWRRGVMAMEFWNYGDPEARQEGSDAQFLRDRVLDLPIHQDIGPRQIEFIAEQACAATKAVSSH